MQFVKVTGPVRLWDVGTGTPRAAFLTEADHVGRVTPSADGRWLVVQCHPPEWTENANTFRVLEADTGRERAALAGCHYEHALSQDGQLLAYSDAKDGPTTVRLWDLEAGRNVGNYPGVRESFALSPDCRTLAALAEKPPDVPDTCVIRVWEVATTRELRPLAVPCKSVVRIAFSPDGATLAAEGWQRDTPNDLGSEVHAWDLATGRHRFQRLDASSLVGFAPDGRLALAEKGAAVPCVSWWDLDTGTAERHVYPRLGYRLRTWGGSAEARAGRLFRLTDYSTRSPSWWQSLLAGLPFCAALGREQVMHHTRLLDASDGSELANWEEFERESAYYWGVCSADGRTFVTPNGTGRVQVWDVPPRKPLGLFLALAAVFALPPALLVRWRIRRPRGPA
jgi:WD40 repeat protein